MLLPVLVIDGGMELPEKTPKDGAVFVLPSNTSTKSFVVSVAKAVKLSVIGKAPDVGCINQLQSALSP